MKIHIKQYYEDLNHIISSPSKYEVNSENGSLIEHKSKIKRAFYAVGQLFGFHTASKLTYRYISHNDWTGFSPNVDVESANRIMGVIRPLNNALKSKNELSSSSPLIQAEEKIARRVRAVFSQLEAVMSSSNTSSSGSSSTSVRRGFLAVPSIGNYNRLKHWVRDKERSFKGQKIEKQGDLENEYQRDCLGRSMLVTAQFGKEEVDRHGKDRKSQLPEKMSWICDSDEELINWVKYYLTGNGIGSFFSGISELTPKNEGDRGWKRPDVERVEFTKTENGISVILRSQFKEQRHQEIGPEDTGIQKSLSVRFDIIRDESGQYSVQNVRYNLSGWLL